MVQTKGNPAPLTAEMSSDKCMRCDIVINRKGENRPGIRCRDCRKEYCFKCADLRIEFCDMVREMGKEIWKCGECESKDKDLKCVLESIQSLHSEVKTLKQGQEEQQVERERVIEGLKVVETVAKRIDSIESAQEAQAVKISENEVAVQENSKKIENIRKTTAVEERLNKMDSDSLNA